MDEKTEWLIENIKGFNETIALEMQAELSKLESQIQHNQRIFDRKITELNELKQDSTAQYAIWDKEANQWLSPKHYCINQNGKVISLHRREALCNQEDFEIIFLTEMDKNSMDELIGYAGVGKMIEKQMEESKVIAFGRKTGRLLFFKYRWTKIYQSFRELIYSCIGKESYKRKMDREMQKLDEEIKEWERAKASEISNVEEGSTIQGNNRVKE